MRTFLYCLMFFMFSFSTEAQQNNLPEDFVYVKKLIPDLVTELRYAGSHNFTGRPVAGYINEVVILSRPAAKALAKVQKDLEEEGFCLKVFDAYRPQQAVDSFIAWAKKPSDTLTKQEFYPEQQKKNLFKLGYIASRSGHSRGSTVDLTMVDAQTGKEVNMGGSYDYFGNISHHTTSAQISSEEKKHRQKLKHIMEKHGFRAYAKEWWHYTLRKEPYPHTYFNFEVK